MYEGQDILPFFAEWCTSICKRSCYILPLTDFQGNIIIFIQKLFYLNVGCLQNLQKINRLQKMITFIRHAQSLHNQKTSQYVQQSKIIYDWHHLSNDHYFLHEIKYCPQLLDCTITQKGIEQCAQARQKMVNLKPDLILVSPLNRTLATCCQIFKDASCKIIALPILGQGLRNACDFSKPIQEKKKQYSVVDFESVEKEGLYWYLINDSEQNKATYLDLVNTNKQKTYIQILKIIFEYMEQTKIYQTPTNLRRRTEKLKQILKEYSKIYKNIAVVSHFNIIRFTLAQEFNQNDDPKPCKIGNCQIHQLQIQRL